LGWLAVLATFVHGVGNLLAAWTATVSLVVLIAWRRPTTPPAFPGAPPAADRAPKSPDTDQGPPDHEREAAGGATNPANSTPGNTLSGKTDRAARRSTAEVGGLPGLQVLTAAEAASVLRVEADEIIAAINNGELPGNRIGSHWRVDCGALARWLQGTYGDLAERADPSSATVPRTGPT
jgi:excisionase family DNA binding protein